MEHTITVREDRCIHCGMCIRDCVVSCLEFDENKIPRYMSGGEAHCIGCQHCMMVCPKEALSFGGLNPENSGAVSYGNSDELLQLIKSRRSIRSYKDMDVPPEKIDQLVDMLAYAPTGGNAPSVHVTIIATKEKMDAFRQLSYDCLMAVKPGSPLYRLKKMAAASLREGKDFLFRGANALVVASFDKAQGAAICETVDPIISLSYLDLYATSLGLGTVWDGFAVAVAQEFPELREALQIPKGCTMSFILGLGVPNIVHQRAAQRTTDRVTVIK